MTNRVIGRILLEDTIDSVAPIRSAQKQSSGVVKMEVVLQDVERINRNKRLYRKKAIDDAIKADFIKEKLATNSLLGEMNHPTVDSNDLGRQTRIDLNNVSHVIKEIYWDKNDKNVLLGIVETAGTRVGKDFAGLIMENGMTCSFSMRGSGEVVDRGSYREVAGPIRIVTWDAVHFPSHKTAYMKRFINEENTQLAITESMIINEVAKRSENVQMLQELMDVTDHMVSYKMNGANKVLIEDIRTGKTLGYTEAEKHLLRDYRDFMASLRA